jgi:hypothetical protein
MYKSYIVDNKVKTLRSFSVKRATSCYIFFVVPKFLGKSLLLTWKRVELKKSLIDRSIIIISYDSCNLNT